MFDPGMCMTLSDMKPASQAFSSSFFQSEIFRVEYFLRNMLPDVKRNSVLTALYHYGLYCISSNMKYLTKIITKDNNNYHHYHIFKASHSQPLNIVLSEK